jgi:protocatechuate 3,4-dioxygenase beta subunit
VATLVARADPAAADRLVFDIHLQGDQETVFFDV